MLSQLIQCYGVFNAFFDLFQESLLFLFIVEPALIIKVFARADMAKVHFLWRYVRNGIVVVHEAESISLEILIEFVGEFLVSHTR